MISKLFAETRRFALKVFIVVGVLTLCVGLASATTSIGTNITTDGTLNVGGNFGISTTTPGSLFSIGGITNFTTATSTFYSSGGINLAGGCFAVNGTCVGGGSSSGIVKITSGTINSPTETLDIVLPDGYAKFVLELQDLKVDSEDNVTYRFSSDGGATFHTGSTDYKNVGFNVVYGTTTDTSRSGHFFDDDSMGYLMFDAHQDGDASIAVMATITIWPGSASSYPLVRSDSTDINANIYHSNEGGFPGSTVYTSALTAATARQNVIRIGGYFGDGDNLTSGTYILYGYQL
jgi:hypothetical protein